MDWIVIAVNSALVLTILADAILLIFIFSKQPTGPIYWLILLHLLGILGWAFSILFLLQSGTVLATQLAFATALLLTVAKFYFILSFPGNQLPHRLIWYWPLVPALVGLGLSFIDGAYFQTVKIVDGYYVSIDNGQFSLFYVLLISFFLICPIIVLFNKFRNGVYETRVHAQLKYLFFGMTFFFVLGFVTNSLLPVVFDIYYFNGTGPSFALILAGFIIFIIYKHHFLNINLIIQRALIYTILLIGIVSVYLLTLTTLGQLLPQLLKINQVISAGFTTILGIFSVPYIDHWLRRKTDKIFYQDDYDYEEALSSLSEILNNHISKNKLISKVSGKLRQLLKVSEITVDFSDQPVEIAKDRTTVTIPLHSKRGHIGSLFLGEKLSGDLYTIKDIHLLNTLSYQLATALERSALYEEVKSYSKELEAKVDEKTTKLEQAQEQQLQMIHNISHSLQTPLTIIKSELEQFKKGTPNSKGLAVLDSTLNDLSTFVYDFLKLAEIETNSDQITLDKVNLSQQLEEIIEYVTTVTNSKKITLDRDIAAEITVLGHEQKLKELFLTLLSNAVKYMGTTGKRVIMVNLFRKHNWAVIEISDTGIGIEPAELTKVFNRFYRVQTDSAVTGSGLGLAICQSIVDLHQGDITATSEPGQGSTFTVILPITSKDKLR